MLRVQKDQLAKVLNQTRFWRQHLDFVAAAAAAEGVGMSIIGKWVYFIREEDAEECAKELDVADAVGITDEFEAVYGSKRGNTMWEDGTYRPPQKSGKPTAKEMVTAAN